ncbi:hypothetical protein [Jeotgalibaca porci]|uniref:hypothetical protein n=1 Tax=Jeotgalibaca porci TaxID=1868793 RepID=UPI0035A09635
MDEWLAIVAGAITSITIIGAFLVKVVDKIIIKPMDKRKADRAKEVELDRQKFERTLLERVEANQQPLAESIDRLNDLLEESQRDRVNLHKIAEVNVTAIGEHEERLDLHNERLIVLEVKNGVRKLAYKEEE